MGYVTAAKQGGTVDAAFVRLESSYTMMDPTLYGTTLSYVVATPTTNMHIYKEGVETGKTDGTIFSANTTIPITLPSGSTIQLTNVCQANYTSDEGDSGGVVYTDIGRIVGIHCGRYDGYARVIKAMEIQTQLNVVPW